MKKYIKKILIVILTIILGPPIFAQTNMNVASKIVEIDGLQFEYSIGEMALIQTQHNSGLIVTQGFLQPHKNSSQTIGDLALEADNALIIVFPNPTKNELFIETRELIESEIKLQLFDGAGKLVLESTRPSNSGNSKFSIQLNNLVTGNYFLIATTKTKSNNNYKQIFKIQKN
jgi:hypothetical protein